MRPYLGLGPILFKDFTIAARRGRTYIWRAVGLGVIGLFLMLAYPAFMASMQYAGRFMMSQAGLMLTSNLLMICYLIVSLAAPAMVVGAFLEERDRGTLGLLLASPLGPWRVAAGKTIGAVLRIAAWTLGVAPLLFFLLAFGGVEAGGLAAAYAEVFAGGLMATAFALMLLSFKSKGPLLIVRVYFLLILYVLILPLVTSMLSMASPMSPTSARGWAEYAPWMVWNPLLGCFSHLSGLGGAGGISLMGPLASIATGIALTGIGVVLLALRLGREPGMGPPARRRRVAKSGPGPGSLPVYWYESRIRPRGQRRSRVMTAIIAILITSLIALAFAFNLDLAWNVLGTIIGFGLLVLVIIGAMVRGAWAGGDPRSEIPLFVSDLPEPRVALEKAGAILRTSLIGVFLTGVAFIVAVSADRWHDDSSMIDVVMILGSVAMAVLALGCLGMLLGRATGSHTRGSVAAIGSFVGVAIGLPMLLGFARMAMNVSEGWYVIVAATDPLFLAAWLLQQGPRESWTFGSASLGIQAGITMGLVYLTARLWGPLTRRHA